MEEEEGIGAGYFLRNDCWEGCPVPSQRLRPGLDQVGQDLFDAALELPFLVPGGEA